MASIAKEEDNHHEINNNLKNIQCHYCHKFGHMKFQCPRRNRTRRPFNPFDIECNYCHEYGHMKYKCPKLIRKEMKKLSMELSKKMKYIYYYLNFKVSPVIFNDSKSALFKYNISTGLKSALINYDLKLALSSNFFQHINIEASWQKF
mmetsp:Transcript_9059/g.12018  ORF Transcript_9059/g.12018 Transcript_9059/m.12018 type:complete len:148 (-) Transcript_9059:357-800(-)